MCGACQNRRDLLGGINVMGGKITFAPVAAAHGLEATDIATMFS